MTQPGCFHELGLDTLELDSGEVESRSPIDGRLLGRVRAAGDLEVDRVVADAQAAFAQLRNIPAPRRGALIHRFGQELRANKVALAELVSLECGKVRQEALGEVQEMIDICDFAVGLSRQLYGLTIASERPNHRLMETWHPLGPVAVISAFNFPVAVWAWNSTLAIVCGDPVVWKPSDKTPLCALACQLLLDRAIATDPELPAALSQVIVGGRSAGERLAESRGIALVSATGSCAMGEAVAPVVAQRMGRYLLELGGNNAMIITESADLALALPAALFSAVGTAGQRCTTLRRLIVHESRVAAVLSSLQASYKSLPIGSPLEEGTLVGPLIDQRSYDAMTSALAQAQREGGTVICGGQRALIERYPQAYYAQPALVHMPKQTAIVATETFAPILYVMAYRELDDAIEMNNAVVQGLSSSIFTTDMREAERFLSSTGSDCGIANVNVGPSGAEIGGAFGGEKATGGGRESGSDAWKSYMRRATNTINYGSELPLAQGIRFDIPST